MKNQSIKNNILWNYCECGCKGSEVSIGAYYFWLYNDIKGSYHLHQGHSQYSPKIGQYNKMSEATSTVKKIMVNNLKEISEYLGYRCTKNTKATM
jgi:hypothetical protein